MTTSGNQPSQFDKEWRSSQDMKISVLKLGKSCANQDSSVILNLEDNPVTSDHMVQSVFKALFIEAHTKHPLIKRMDTYGNKIGITF